jgi:hypothetical protein
MYFHPCYASRYPGDRRFLDAREDLSMIFRQFLAPKTGCASYVFG